MTLSEVAKYRLVNQQIAGTEIPSAVDMVEWFAAVQGQEYAQTKWALGLRLPNSSDNEIEKLLTEGKILRTHLLRPTWHFVSAKDIRWLLTLTAPRVNAANAFMYRQLELDNKIFNRCNDILINSLEGRQLTRDAINEEFKKNGIIAVGHRLSYIMMHAELDGIICSGARKENQFTYALLNERVKPQKVFEKEEALAELTTRYFKSRGPATIKDFATWSGLTITECKKGIEIVTPHLNKTVVESREYYYASLTGLDDKPNGKIYLLPLYDEYVMGYKDRSAMMITKDSIKAAPSFLYDNMILSNGQVIGTWKRTIKREAIHIEFDLFQSFSKGQEKALNQAVHRLGEFTNMTTEIAEP